MEQKYHKHLIGAGGKVKKQLEEQHGVVIMFPRHEDHEDSGAENDRFPKLKSNEIQFRGPKASVASAMSDMQSLVAKEVSFGVSL